jgi:hypothetical protein
MGTLTIVIGSNVLTLLGVVVALLRFDTRVSFLAGRLTERLDNHGRRLDIVEDHCRRMHAIPVHAE